MSPRNPIAPGEFYHLYQRGVDGRVVFCDEADHWRFIVLLHLANSSEKVRHEEVEKLSLREVFELDRSERLVDIGAYCLMPNHFHILAREREDGNMATFMQKVMTAYTMYFNRKNKRKGALFGASYRAEHISDDRYLKYMFSYIHLNPVSLIEPGWKIQGIKNFQRTKKYLEEYKYSSFLDYCSNSRPQGGALTRSAFPDYFAVPGSFQAFIDEWISFSELDKALFMPDEEREE
ncbi:MAG: transposase [Candidatus Paceibacterota bacterium]